MLEPAQSVVADGVHAELSEDGDHAEQRPTHGRSGVYLGLGQGPDIDAAVPKLEDHVNGHPLGPGDAIEAPHDEGVASLEAGKTGQPLRPLCDATGLTVIDEHSLGPARYSSAT